MMTLTPERIHEVIWTLAAKYSDKAVSEIRPESRLIQDLGADSLTVVEFSMELEEELGLTFPDNVLEKPNLTMADVEKAILDSGAPDLKARATEKTSERAGPASLI